MTAGATDQLVERAYPLSPLQQGLLFHSVSTAGADIYVRQVRYDLTGPIDADALTRAWRVAAAAHQPLRTGIFWEGLATPLQVVSRRAELELAVEDVDPLAAGGRYAAIAGVELRDRATGFDLRRPPLIRVSLVRLGDEDHALVLTFHHIVVDGWSMPLLLGDVFLAYAQLVQGEEPVLPPRRPVTDYLAWLEKQPIEEAYGYWRRRLHGLPREPASLLVENRPPDSPHRQLTVDVATEVTAAARSLRITPASLLYGAWALALADTLDSDDVLFGALVSGRPEGLPGAEGMVGLFLNTLPTRVRLDPRQRVRDWLRAVQADALADRRHGYVALPEIARRCDLPPGRSPVESLVVYQNAPSILPAGADEFAELLRVEPVIRVESDGMPLVLEALPADGVRLVLGYDATAVEPEVAQALLDRTVAALDQLVRRPDATLADLDPAGPANVASTEADCAEADLFGLLADAPDDRPAVVDADRVHTYAELRSAATGVATWLRQAGVSAERPVVVAVRPGFDFTAALFGVWRAGGLAVPAPAERLDAIVADCSAVAVLADAPTRSEVPVLVVADVPPAEPATHRDLPYATAAALALYPPALYPPAPAAPGSMPPAVVLPYGSLAAAARSWVDGYDLDRHARHLVRAGACVDSLVVQVLGAVAAGATMVLAPAGDDPAALVELANRHDVGVLQLDAPTARKLADAERGTATVGTLVLTGDRLPLPVYERLRALLPDGATIRQVYGAAEAGIDTVFGHAPDATDEAGADRLDPPLAAGRVAVLDRLGRPVGAPGRGTLLLGGTALARGYLGRPGATAASFVPDPTGPPGSRLFRTGDRVRLRGGGIDRHGPPAYRSERGFRFPLAELETALTGHPAVDAAAAVSVGGQLTAVIEAVPETVDSAALRRILDSLPAPLRPDRIAAVTALPRRRDGHLDRSGLAALVARAGDADAATTSAARLVARAFADVLRVDRVGPHDSFFALGGDSLLALTLVGRLRENGLAVELRDLLEEPTVAALADRGVHRPARPTVAAAPAPDGAEFPLAPAQLRFFAHRGEAPAAVDLVEGVELDGELDPADVQAAIAAVAAAHQTLRSRFLRRDGQWIQQVAGLSDPTAVPRLVTHDLREYGQDEADRVAARLIGDLRSTDDLGTGAPWSVLLLLRPDRSQLVVAVHHLACDPYSWSVLLGDLVRATLLGPEVVSRDNAGAYGAWSRYLRELLADSAGGDAEFWTNEFTAVRGGCPTDAEDEPNSFGARAEVSVEVPPDVTAALLRDDERDARHRGAGIEARLAAALARAYTGWTGQAGLPLLVQSSGRDLAPAGLDVSRTVGWFTCLVPVWIPVGAEAPDETVRRARTRLDRSLRRKHSWDLLRHAQGAPDTVAELVEPAIALDYVGQVDRGVVPPEDSGVRPLFRAGRPRPVLAPSDPTMRRTALIGVEVVVAAGVLRALFHYSRNHHREPTITKLADQFRHELLATVGATEPDRPRPVEGSEHVRSR